MSLVLSSVDLAKLTDTMALLTSPLDLGVDEWRSRVNTRLKDLLNADTACFLLPEVDGPLFYSDDFDPETLDRYDLQPPALPDGTCMVERGIELGVSTLEKAYGPHLDVLHGSAYHNDYARLLHKHGTLFTMCRLGATGPIASLQFFHERPGGRQFGERELALLRLLFPAFRAGAETHLRWRRHRDGLLSALDGLHQAVLVFDRAGTPLHQTPTLTAALQEDPAPEVLREALHGAMQSVRRMAAARVSRGDASAAGCTRDVQTAHARYRVRGCLFGEAVAGASTVILTTLERATPKARSEAELRELFGLTRAEVRAAMLLALGRSNEEVARELVISPHTARRHTERVLRKLGVHSRSEVGARLLS